MNTRACILILVATLGACRSFEFPGYDVNVGVPVPQPADVDAVVFLVGDAGEAVTGTSPVLERLRADIEHWSTQLARDSAVSVVFLGDNVYPDGMHERTHPGFPRDSARLWSQIDVLSGEAALRHRSVGLFLTGNHDWGNMAGDAAFERVKNLEAELVRARDTGPYVALQPPAGLPGPVIRDLRDNVRLILMDSHWFLRETSEAARTIFFRDLRRAIGDAGEREVILLSHHPFATAGPHGALATGTRSFGVLYVLQRSGTLVQDLNSPAYGSFRDRMRIAFEQSGKIPLVFAGGHDHSLQVLDGLQPGDPRNILVSGAASKLTPLGDTLGLRYGAERPGYMALVFRKDGAVELFVTAGDPRTLSCPESPEEARVTCMSAAADSFHIVWSEELPTEPPEDPAAVANGEAEQPVEATDTSVRALLAEIDPPPPAIPPAQLEPHAESVVASPGQTYDAGPLRRLFFGDLNRDLWEIEFTLPVLDLDSVGGGLEPSQLSGGKQTLGMRFMGKNGLEYQFRSIVKDASRALPGALHSGPVDAVVQDQMGAQFPLGAALVAEFLKAAGILVAAPTAVIMPDDPQLGDFRETFAGRMGWIEVRPEEREDDKPGFAGSRDVESTAELFEALREDPESYLNEREFVRARLIDMFVNDWDRHADNWRWAGFEEEEEERKRWDPVPRDRDWAFARIDGLFPRLAGVFYPKYVSFGESYPGIKRLMWAGALTDRRLLGGVERSVFMEEQERLQAAFSDSVIDAAINTLPPEYQAVEAERLRTALRARRDELARATGDWYRLLAEWVDLHGTVESDSLDLSFGADSVTARLFRGEERFPGFERTFHASETRELRIYLVSGSEVVTMNGTGQTPIRIRLIAEPGAVRLVHDERATLLLDEGNVERIGGVSFHHTDVPVPPEETSASGATDIDDPILPAAAVMAWDPRDWGSQWMVSPAVDYESEYGFHLGAKVTRIGFGFRQYPHSSRFEVELLASRRPDRLVGELMYEKRINLSGLALRFDFEGYTLRHSRFFGIGNATRDDEPESFYTGFRSFTGLDAGLFYRSPGEGWSIWAGPRIQRWGAMDASADPLIFDSIPVYGSAAFSQIGLQGGIEVDGRDDPDAPRDGVRLQFDGRAFPKTGDLRAAHGGVRATVRSYWGLPGPFEPALHVQLFGERVWGDPPYPEMAALGGRRSLPGYRTGRFLGDAAASASTLLRLSLLRFGGDGGIHLGPFGIATLGRVWLNGIEDPTDVHTALGGGLFVRSDEFGRSVSISFVKGAGGVRTYLGLGFPF